MTSNRAIVFYVVSCRFRARCRDADFQRRGAAKNTDRLREPKQLGDAAIYGAAKGVLQSRRLEVEIIQMNPRLGATAVVNGDVSFATPFTSTFRGVLQGFPMKLVFIHLKKGPYYVMVRPEIKDVQQLKGKKIGVATIKGTDQLVAEEMLQAKGSIQICCRRSPSATGQCACRRLSAAPWKRSVSRRRTI